MFSLATQQERVKKIVFFSESADLQKTKQKQNKQKSVQVFNKAAVTVQGSFTKYIRNTYFKNSLEGYFGNLNLIYIGLRN